MIICKCSTVDKADHNFGVICLVLTFKTDDYESNLAMIFTSNLELEEKLCHTKIILLSTRTHLVVLVSGWL